MTIDQFINPEHITVKCGEALEAKRAFDRLETPDRQQVPIGLDIFQDLQVMAFAISSSGRHIATSRLSPIR